MTWQQWLEPLLNQRGQYFPLGVAPGPTGGDVEEKYTYEPFTTSEPAREYGDLIARYQSLMGGGTGSLQAYQNLQRNQGLEMIRNQMAARGLGGRSGVGVAGAARFLGEFEPRAAAQQAEYMAKLIGDYGTAVGQGRTQRTALRTGATRRDTSSGAGAGGSSPFQYIPSSSSGGGAGGSGGGGGSIPQFGGGGYGGGFTNSYLGGGGSSPYIPGGMEAAGYSQLGGSGAYSKSLFAPGSTVYGKAGGGYVSQEQMQAEGGQPGMGYDSGSYYTPGANPAIDAFVRSQGGTGGYGDLSSPYTTSTGASLIGNPWEY